MHELIVAGLPVGTILYHKDREHYYRLLAKTVVKMTNHVPSWQEAWIYHRVEVSTANSFCWTEPVELFTRFFKDFDIDWSLVVS